MMRTLLDSPRPGFDINSEDSVTHQLPKLVQDMMLQSSVLSTVAHLAIR